MILRSNDQDSRFLSADIAVAFDPNTALVIQQLHYWIKKGQGKVIDGVRWIYNTYKDWTSEQLKFFSTWQLRRIFGRLRQLGIVRVKRHWAKHYNQTNFYTLDYDRLVKFVKEKTGVTIEMDELCDSTNRGEDCPQIEVRTAHNSYTNTTSKDYIQREDSPPTPSVEKTEREQIGKSAFKEDLENLDNEDFWLTEPKDKSEVKKDKSLTRQKETSAVTQKKDKIQHKKHRQLGLDSELAPWSSIEEFNLFYEALIKALPTVANASCPSAVAKPIVQSLCDGVMHDYWLDWKKGDAIGTSQQQEWHVAPGIAHPMFIEYLAEKLIKGNNTQTREQAIAEALKIARRPQEAIFFWKECKISLGNALSEAERHQALGVQALPTPLWTKERPEPTLEEAAIAGIKIQQINDSTRNAIEAAQNPQIEGGKSQEGALPHSTENTPEKSDSGVSKKPKISDYAPERVKRFLERGSRKPKGFGKR